MKTLATDDPLAVAAVETIRSGNIDALKRMLAENPDLATARLGDSQGGMSRHCYTS